jgi:hypothetical protein
MAHFAEIENGIVVNVIVVDNARLLDGETESETKGLEFLASLFPGKTFVQTSYNSNIRYNYAGIGYTYDEVNNAFIPPMPTSNPRDENDNEIAGTWNLNSSFRWEFTAKN